MAAHDSEGILEREADGPTVTVRYGDGPDGVIDVFAGSGESGDGSAERPRLVVLLHGGFWRQSHDRVHVRPLAWALVAEGLVVATPEYRRVGDGGGWPTTGNDVELALSRVRELVADALPGSTDPAAPVVLAGHSAGGHLALWAGLRAGPEAVAEIVALAPVTDVVYAAQARLGAGAAQALLGGEPDEQPELYADANAVSLLPGAVPVTIIQGDADDVVPVEMNRQIADELSVFDGGSSFRYVEQLDTGHFELIDPDSNAWPAVLRAISAAARPDAE